MCVLSPVGKCSAVPGFAFMTSEQTYFWFRTVKDLSKTDTPIYKQRQDREMISDHCRRRAVDIAAYCWAGKKGILGRM